jgi:phospholipase C
LPYQPNAICILNTAASTFSILMTNSGAASVHFAVYPNAFRTDGAWPYDVNTSSSDTAVFSTAASAGKYDFSCYGPNGFQRRFAGDLTSDFQKIEAVAVLNPVNRGVGIQLQNSSSAAVTFVLTNGYSVNGSNSYLLAAHSTNLVNAGSETNNGFYDMTVTASADAAFVRRFLGRVEAYTLPRVTSQSVAADGSFQVSFTGPAGQPYRLLATTNLLDAAGWVSLAASTFGTEPVVYTDSNASSRPMRFYRVSSP